MSNQQVAQRTSATSQYSSSLETRITTSSDENWNQQGLTTVRPQVLWTTPAAGGMSSFGTLAFTCQPAPPTDSSTNGSPNTIVSQSVRNSGEKVKSSPTQQQPGIADATRNTSFATINRLATRSSLPRVKAALKSNRAVNDATNTMPSTTLEPVEKYSEGGAVTIGRQGSAIFSANNSQWLGPMPSTDTRESQETITTSPLVRDTTRMRISTAPSPAVTSTTPATPTPAARSTSATPISARWYRRPGEDYGILTIERMEKNECRKYQVKVPVSNQLQGQNVDPVLFPCGAQAQANDLLASVITLAEHFYSMVTALLQKLLPPRTDR